MYKYAQIDINGVCYAISELSGEVVANDMIRIGDNDDTQYLGMIYSDGEWRSPEESEGINE